MRISIASFAFHGLLSEGKMDVFSYLESCRYRYHLDTADIWNGMLPTTDGDFIQKVKDALDERDLVLVNLAVDGAHIWDPDPSVRERNHQNALAHLTAAATLGAQSVRIDMGGRDLEMSSEQFDCIVNHYQEYCRIGTLNGFTVGPENHFGPALALDNIRKVQEAVDSPSFGVLLHLDRWAVDKESGDSTIAPWAMHIHVSDSVMSVIDQKLQLLSDAGYRDTLGIEFGGGTNEYSEVEWQIAGVKRSLKRLGF
jgi:sugar phosphate isomerase/epimerase